ncbi:MAG TPA: carbonic anhydrase family protein [Polyangiaceae bacterium]|nr:carbonic anhydrase family protein [Polyangiaceae bacterium]
MKKPLISLALWTLAACASSQQPAASPAPEAEPAPVDATKEPAAESDAAHPDAAPSAPADAKTDASPDAKAKPGSEEAAEHPAVSYLSPEASDHSSQSPINIVSSRTVQGKHKIKFHYQSSKEHVDNLGHTVKVTYDTGSSLEYDGQTYDLVQFHFHTPSEHLLDGVTYPMEMHLVHAQHEHPEHLLVVGVLFKEGNPSKLLQGLIADVPEHAGEHADKEAKLDASSVLKKGEGYFHYEGSLTTPPYSETVTWLVLDQPHDASAEQIEAMNRIEGNNARHIQDQHARVIDHWR